MVANDESSLGRSMASLPTQRSRTLLVGCQLYISPAPLHFLFLSSFLLVTRFIWSVFRLNIQLLSFEFPRLFSCSIRKALKFVLVRLNLSQLVSRAGQDEGLAAARRGLGGQGLCCHVSLIVFLIPLYLATNTLSIYPREGSRSAEPL